MKHQRLTHTILCFLLLGCAIVPTAFAQIVAPESGVWDDAHSRYLFSCAGNGTIVSRSLGGQTSIWASGLTQPKGMALLGDTLYVTDVTIVRAYNLNSGQFLFTMTFPASSFLNDIAVDTEFIFVSDMQVNAIYRATVGSRAGSPYCVGNVQAPNGIWIDHPNNRVLFVSFRVNSPIQSVSRTESGSATTVRTTTLSELDGFTCDRWGRYYVTSWTTNSVYQISLQESSTPVVVASNINGPADMFIGPTDSVLVVPAMNANQIQFVPFSLPPTGRINSLTGSLRFYFHPNTPCYENIFVTNTGTVPLHIDSIRTNQTYFFPSPDSSYTVEPSDTISIRIGCLVPYDTSRFVWGDIYLFSDDRYQFVTVISAQASNIDMAVSEPFQNPIGFSISPLYPNPFNAEAKLRVKVTQATHLQISLHNLEGRFLQSIENRNVTPGVFDYSLSSQSLANGVYFVQIRGNGRPIATHKAVVLK
ncbi:MAG: T9SS type A sorting domain-containing protein [bacterium]|nr:T9SS type A sorting domain-containing protein [bacterium]